MTLTTLTPPPFTSGAFAGDKKIKAYYEKKLKKLEGGFPFFKRYIALGDVASRRGWNIPFEHELGIDRLLPALIEGLTKRRSRKHVMLPKKFLKAIPVGSNTYRAYYELVNWVFEHDENGLMQHVQLTSSTTAIQYAVALYRKSLAGNYPTFKEWESASLEIETALNLAIKAKEAALIVAENSTDEHAFSAARAHDKAEAECSALKSASSAVGVGRAICQHVNNTADDIYAANIITSAQWVAMHAIQAFASIASSVDSTTEDEMPGVLQNKLLKLLAAAPMVEAA